MMELFKAIKERRSVRVFSDRHVDDSKIEKVIEAARWAPSACNEQAWEFIVVRDAAMKERLVKEANAVPFSRMSPVLIYVLYRGDVTAENHANIQSASAAAQNMLLASHALGLGSVWINSCGERLKVKALLGIPRDLIVVCSVAIGYPSEVPKPPKRTDPGAIVHKGKYMKGRSARSALPGEWSLKELEQQRERGIRAKSPTPDSYPPRFRKEFEREVAAFAEALGKPGKALDILSFSGTHLLAMVRESGRGSISVYETSGQIADFIEMKRKSMKVRCGMDFGIGGLDRIPYPKAKFDLVTCIKKLEMMPDPERMIREMRRVLRPGGRLMLSFWNPWNVYGLNWFVKKKIMGSTDIQSNEGPATPLSAGAVRRLLEKNGFKIRSMAGINFMPGLPESYMTRSVMMKFCRTIIMECEK